MIVHIVIPSESYGFKSFDPIAFETVEEANDYIRLRKEANELEGLFLHYELHTLTVQSRRKRHEVLERIRSMKEKKDDGDSSN